MPEFECIDFDRYFSEYVSQWVQEHLSEFGNDMDRVEEQMPQVYLRWLNTAAPWLEGQAPGRYYERFEDAEQLVRGMCAHFARKVPVPDPLLERIVSLGEDSARQLNALLTDAEAPYEAVLTAMSLLREQGSALPLRLYVDTIADAERITEQVELAAEGLLDMGEIAVPEIMAILPAATEAAETIFLDILCNYPGDERIYALAMRKFAEARENCAQYASYLGKLGDPRAIPALVEAAEALDTNYLDYIEIANAVEELGGDPVPGRDFSGDPYYESLKGVEP